MRNRFPTVLVVKIRQVRARPSVLHRGDRHPSGAVWVAHCDPKPSYRLAKLAEIEGGMRCRRCWR